MKVTIDNWDIYTGKNQSRHLKDDGRDCSQATAYFNKEISSLQCAECGAVMPEDILAIWSMIRGSNFVNAMLRKHGL